jgi:hypothetical protein
MKKHLIILIFFICAIKTQGQIINPIPDSNAFWMFSLEESMGVFGHYGVFMPKHKQDTIINGIPYLKAYKFEDNFGILNFNYLCSYRIDSSRSRAYAIPPNETNEYKLIDYNLNVGDSFDSLILFLPPEINCINNSSILKATAKIKSIYEEQIQGNSYMYFNLDVKIWNDTNILYDFLQWNGYHLYHSGTFNVPLGFCLQNPYSFCVSINDTVVYNYLNTFNQDLTPPNIGSCSNCIDIFSSINIPKKTKNVSVFKNENNVLFHNGFDLLSIYDLYGSMVFSYKNKLNGSIDLSLLPRGVYILVCEIGDNLYNQKIIIQ